MFWMDFKNLKLSFERRHIRLLRWGLSIRPPVLKRRSHAARKVGVWCNICGKHGFLRFTKKALEREVVVAFTTNTKKCIQFGPWRLLFSRVEILRSGRRLTVFLVLRVFWFFSTYSWLVHWARLALYSLNRQSRCILAFDVQSFKHVGNVFHYINTPHEVLEFN
jgi:hypothetical protein